MEATTWLQLPEPDRSTLSAAPLELVVLQVKFERKADMSPQVALALKSEMGDDVYPHLEQAISSEVIFQMSPSGAATTENRAEGWRFMSQHRKWVVSVFPDWASLECTGYTDWDEFRERSNVLLQTVESLLSPQLVHRVGLRYIDRIILRDTAKPADWDGLIADEVLGFAASHELGQYLTTVKTEQVVAMDDVTGVVRTSCGPDNQGPTRHSIVIDTDCFEQSAFGYNLAALALKVEKLHDRALQLFQLVTSTQLRARLTS